MTITNQQEASASTSQGAPPYADPEKSLLDAYLSSKNIAKLIDDTRQNEIGQRVVRDYNIDEHTRGPWLERNKNAMKLATQVIEAKNFPWPDAANIKYPLLTTACIQFSSRAYPNLIPGTNVVKAKVVGKDDTGEKAARATRIGEHMSYQFTEEMEEWPEDMDSLLVALPIEGCEFKKSYFSAAEGRNVSELVRPENLVVNYRAKSLRKASRITHKIWLYPNEVVERVRAGTFLDIELGLPSTHQDPGTSEESPPQNDEDAPHLFLEQHRYLDLDDDGYQEPYICTVHKDTGTLVRIVARWDADGVKWNDAGKIQRIEPVHYFTRYIFMPSPDGGIYGMGFGILAGPINETVNTTINQLLDAGTRQNTGGGFIGSGVSLGRGGAGGVIRLKPGEYRQVNFTGDDLRKNIVDLKIPEPSRVLFLLLGFMVDAGKEMISVSEVLTGEQRGSNIPATTTLALIEQGLKVFSAIYIRIHRALRREFRKVYRLNRLFLEDETYYMVLDDPRAIKRIDYEEKSLDVLPVSNPRDVSDTAKLLKAEALMGLIGQGFNDNAIRLRYLQAMNIEDVQDLLPPEGSEPPRDPRVILDGEKLELERDKFELDMIEARGRILKMRADTLVSIARAEAQEAGPQIEIYKTELAALEKAALGIFSQREQKAADRRQKTEGGQENE